MPTIDTSTISGYANMTAEEKVAALEAHNIPDPKDSGWIEKSKFDKLSSDFAALKKSSKTSTEDAQKIADLEQTVKNLTEDKLRGEHKAKFMALGYDEALAASTADALVKGDMETVFANQKTFLTKHDNDLAAAALKNTPTPPAGKTPTGDDNDIQKKVDAAMARGDYAAAAAYTAKLYEAKTK